MNISEFVAKWNRSELRERQASQSHFLDLCRLLGHPEPADADPRGESFCFERGAAKHGGGDGWADVWKRGFFGWEYKGRHKDLDAAYDQLLLYRDQLENPPLLVVSDMDRIVIRTNYTNTKAAKFEMDLASLSEPRNLEILRAVFLDPDKLRPGATSAAITKDAAGRIARIAQSLRGRGLDPAAVAHFLDRIIFCLFAEDVGLLPKDLFTRIVANTKHAPAIFSRSLRQLFESMAAGGLFGADVIKRFNGNLFNSSDVLDLLVEEIEDIAKAAALDWDAVDPSIFGTLFERGMDPAKRSQLGAHYTSRDDILAVVEPVVMAPLRREWNATKRIVETLLATGKKPVPGADDGPITKNQKPKTFPKSRSESVVIVHNFLDRLAAVKVLDPACGSGNFLYVTLQKMKDLEKEVILFANGRLAETFLPQVGPWQLFGIEINPYAHDLAQMTVWIGYLQWTRANGFGVTQDPILRPLNNFFCMDAILDLSDPGRPKEPDWPVVDFIVGNPPFLGGNKIRQELGNQVDDLFKLYSGRVQPSADLCCYWFERSRKQIEEKKCLRAGLLATQGIRGGDNREVLKRIKKTGDIFFSESDREWILDGANVHVSMIGFDDGKEKSKSLNGKDADSIHANLSSNSDTTMARPLKENIGLCFRSSEKGGNFELDDEKAQSLFSQPNPNARPNSDVIVPWLNSQLLLKARKFAWIIDFGFSESEIFVASFEKPYEYLQKHVRPSRLKNAEKRQREFWWLHRRNAIEMRQAIAGLDRFLATTTVSKHRIFYWLFPPMLPDHQLYVFARSDDYFFGVLHSRLHEVWARAQGTQLRERESGFRYTPTTCFETFPFPRPAPEQESAVAAAAKDLDTLRNNWLNPPEWTKTEVLEFPGSADGPWARYVEQAPPPVHGIAAEGGCATSIGTVRYPRLVPKDEACAKELSKRTLTNLYNARPAWLALAHEKLDRAVCAAYGFPPDLTDEQILEKLLALNQERAGTGK